MRTGTPFDPHTFAPVTNPMFSVDAIFYLAAAAGIFRMGYNYRKTLRRIANRARVFTEMTPDGKFFLEVTTNGTYIWGIQQ